MQKNSDHKTPKIKLYTVTALKRYLNEKNLIHGRETATVFKFCALIFEMYFSMQQVLTASEHKALLCFPFFSHYITKHCCFRCISNLDRIWKWTKKQKEVCHCYFWFAVICNTLNRFNLEVELSNQHQNVKLWLYFTVQHVISNCWIWTCYAVRTYYFLLNATIVGQALISMLM